MSDAREALVALVWSAGEVGDELTFECDCENCVKVAGRIADAFLAAGWTPPGERVKPSEEDVARTLFDAEYHDLDAMERDVEWKFINSTDAAHSRGSAWHRQARAVLALLPGRTETEVKAEAWDEGEQPGEDECEECEAWLAAHDRQVRAQELRDAVRDMRAAWSGNWNLPDPRDPEVAYSVDRWLEVRADGIEKGVNR